MTTSVTADHAFDTDTAIVEGADGRFTGSFTDRWNSLGGVVNGGYYVATALQALRQVLPHPDPAVVSTFFSSRGAPGPVEIETEVARRGRRISTGEARLYQGGKELSRTVATFTDLDAGDGRDVLLASPPALPRPEDAIDPVGEMRIPGVTITDQLEFRYATVPGWWNGAPSADPTAEFWMRFKGGRDADTFSLPLLVDGAAPVVLDLGVGGSATVEMTTHVRARPAPGWLACRVATRCVSAGFHEEDFDIWDSAGKLVAQGRQLAVVL